MPRRIAAVGAAISICVTISGCTRSPQNDVKFNLCENIFFTQTDDSFFISTPENISRISKSDETGVSVIHSAFDDSVNLFFTPVLAENNTLYYLEGLTVNAVSLFDYSTNEVYSEKYYNQTGFLDINFTQKPDLSGALSVVTGFFPSGNDFYYIYGSRLYKNGKCVFDDDIFRSMISFDGRNIYYVNNLLQLKCYSVETEEIMRLPGEFVRSIYYDGARLLFSDKNGIFSLNTNDSSVKKLSDVTADALTSDGDKIIYKSGDKLYYLGIGTAPIYEGVFDTFAVLSGTNKLAVIQRSGEYELFEFPD